MSTVSPVAFCYNSQDPFVQSDGVLSLAAQTSGDHPVLDKVELGVALQPEAGGYVFPKGDARNPAANAVATAAHTVAVFEGALGHPVRWAFPGRLQVLPEAGFGLNAFYDREQHALSFFRDWDPKRQVWVHAAASGEVCAHETGHAILDGLRPRYFGSFAPEVNAFHESFGDMVAMVMTLQDERVIAEVVARTHGDLRQPNMIERTGEEMGTAMNHFVGLNLTGGDYQRSALNGFAWQDPATLPYMGTNNALGVECHSFSKVWTGAFYDVVCGLYAHYRGQQADATVALRQAGREALHLLARSVEHAPHGDFTFREMAEAWIRTDRAQTGGRWEPLLRDVMAARGILPADAMVTDLPPIPAEEGRLRTVDLPLRGAAFGMYDGAFVRTVVDETADASHLASLERTIGAFVGRMIQGGAVKYHDPAHVPTPGDGHDPDGRRYGAVVRWEDGHMVLERVSASG